MWIITIHIKQSKSYKRVGKRCLKGTEDSLEMEFTLHELERGCVYKKVVQANGKR